MRLHVGVSGTRHELADAQHHALCRQLLIIDQASDEPITLHHGCCTGADEAAHKFAKHILGWSIEGHPGHGADGRSPWRMPGELMSECNVLHPSRPYYVRNRHINVSSSVLVAAPAWPEDDPRSAHSGTWMTVRDARARGLSITCAWPEPDGLTAVRKD